MIRLKRVRDSQQSPVQEGFDGLLANALRSTVIVKVRATLQ